jgi:NAD(P)-dependent dehydrogenase (short-subunit alcohol dehydrogenase family)
VFVITGGGSGIGRALALALNNLGHPVVIVGRRQSCLDEVVAQAQQIKACCADVATPFGRQTLVDYLRQFQRLQALVHNAGMIEPICTLRELPEVAWRTLMATNLDAPLYLTQALYPQLIGGRVLHIGSGAAYFPVQGWGGYCVSKAALSMLTRCWQLEHPEIAVASVMPGIIDTDMQAVIRASTNMDSVKHDYFLELKRTNRLLSPQTVGEYLAHLLLEVSSTEFVSKEWDIYTDGAHEFPNA